MSLDQQIRRPAPCDDEKEKPETLTYGIVLGVCGEVAEHPITRKDSALMQSAEAHTLGQNQKGGAASVMQSTADVNEKSGKLNRNEDKRVGGYLDMAVTQTAVSGQLLETEYVGGQAVRSNHKFTPTDRKIAASEAITIGQALQAVAAMKAGEKPVEERDARAIQSAEKRATGVPTTKGCVAATAQAAAVFNSCVDEVAEITLSDVLVNAPEKLPKDKVVTREDAKKVLAVEDRPNPNGLPTAGVMGKTLMAAAEINERTGSVNPSESYSYPAEDLNEEVEQLDISGEGGQQSQSCIGYMEIAPVPGSEHIDDDTHPKILVVD